MTRARLLVDAPVRTQRTSAILLEQTDHPGDQPLPWMEVDPRAARLLQLLRQGHTPWTVTEQFLAARGPEHPPECMRVACLGEFADLDGALRAARRLGVTGIAQLDWDVSEDGQRWAERVRV